MFNCFPDDTTYRWTIKHFGPLHIQGNGDKIALNLHNIVLYQPLIQYETQKRIIVKDGHLWLDKDSLLSYTFTCNYCFMAGDQVFTLHNSLY